jgi:hypothetical protein
MKKNENFIGDNAYLAPNMEMIEVETENFCVTSGSGSAENGDSEGYSVARPVTEDFSDLLDF